MPHGRRDAPLVAVPARRVRWLIAILLLYSLSLFTGATLLFAVQPMVGKMVLPLLGGTPAVWSTCMVFFQAALLAGYAYAHVSVAWLGVRRQAVLHLALVALTLAVLPLGVEATRLRGSGTHPVLDVLLLLSISVGLPFFAVSATAPLLQRWFAATGHRAGRDPYFLYAASNLGSMLALLAYPTLIEPRLPLRDAGGWSQVRLWSVGYAVLAVLIGLCALALRRGVERSEPALDEAAAEGPPTLRARLRWVGLALAPSSLLLGVTTYITTDLAAVPLLWVLPLAVYLFSFVVTFGRWPVRWHRAVVALALPAVLGTVFLMMSGVRQRIWITALCHLALLLVLALACHGALALGRPSPRYLTGFYLLIAVGGVLGGAFNALVAPLIFRSLAEYPAAMILACVLVTGGGGATRRARTRLRDVGLALGVGALALVLYSDAVSLRVDLGALVAILHPDAGRIPRWLDTLQRGANKLAIYGPPLLAVFFLRRRPLALALALLGVLAADGGVDARKSNLVHQTRSFFGVLRVTRDRDDHGYSRLHHGTTLHGQQSLEAERRAEPLSYYSRRGPVGEIFAELDRRLVVREIAVIGLGTGTLAAYAKAGDTMTFYEIDGAARDIAFDPAHFTYVRDARARGARILVEAGDARLRLEAVKRARPDERYDLIVVDAFSSDAIPVHLLTREALALYLEMLAPDGMLALHLSNRYLRLDPVVARLAEAAGLGGRLLQRDEAPSTEGATRSTWVVLARTPDALGSLDRHERWKAAKLEVDPRVGLWTDDFHDLLTIFKW
jgi:spermidine synthase